MEQTGANCCRAKQRALGQCCPAAARLWVLQKGRLLSKGCLLSVRSTEAHEPSASRTALGSLGRGQHTCGLLTCCPSPSPRALCTDEQRCAWCFSRSLSLPGAHGDCWDRGPCSLRAGGLHREKVSAGGCKTTADGEGQPVHPSAPRPSNEPRQPCVKGGTEQWLQPRGLARRAQPREAASGPRRARWALLRPQRRLGASQGIFRPLLPIQEDSWQQQAPQGTASARGPSPALQTGEQEPLTLNSSSQDPRGSPS